MKQVIYKYLVYIIYFLGIGMTSSGIVLMPFNIIRYSIILSIGLGLFLIGSVFNEVVINKQHLSLLETIKLIILSLTLAMGIGMISGGIAHFKESPRYVMYLIPLGIVISFISFTFKNKFELTKKEKLTMFLGIIIVAFIVYIILRMFVVNTTMNMTPGGDIFKNGHGH
ncbi:hypothetical protein [Clostridium felsineum]|uniref:Uncharacterized protein n=1 Tax=Clostridium felsineum TaxID=36839 RepID=A0A1S8LPE2_9CLOT|nr:hypothetical protein [Clostridium felsineum]URZ08471.1 hypothetical protein CLROS_038530 [Clostridium felsineum]URZ13502.1 hypothetical protein CROST_042680 [Clostridium felsineum]